MTPTVITVDLTKVEASYVPHAIGCSATSPRTRGRVSTRSRRVTPSSGTV